MENYIGGSPGLHNTKEKQKEIILNLEEISSIYKQKCEKGFFRHETNCFTAENRWKKLKSLIRKGLKSPKTGKHLKLQEAINAQTRRVYPRLDLININEF